MISTQVLYLRPFANAGENAVAIVVAICGVGVLVAVAAAAVLDSDTVLDEAAKAAVVIELAVLGLTVLLPLAAGVARLLRAALFRATGRDSESNVEALQVLGDEAPGACASLLATASRRAGKGCENPNFKGSYLGRFPLVSADFWTRDHLSERSRP